MSQKTRSNVQKSRSHNDTATRKQMEARKRHRARKQRMPAQNKLLMLVGMAILCVALVAPELLALLGTRVAVILKWGAAIAVVLSIAATRYNMTVTEGIGFFVDKLLNRDVDWDDEYEEEDDEEEWDDEKDWDDFDDEEVVEAPKPPVRRQTTPKSAPVESAPAVAEVKDAGWTKEDYELFMQFMEFQKAQKAQANKPEPAPKNSKK